MSNTYNKGDPWVVTTGRFLKNVLKDIINMFLPGTVESIEETIGKKGKAAQDYIQNLIGKDILIEYYKTGRITDKLQDKIDSINSRFGGSSYLKQKRAEAMEHAKSLRDEATDALAEMDAAKSRMDNYKATFDNLTDTQKEGKTGQQIIDQAQMAKNDTKAAIDKISAIERRI